MAPLAGGPTRAARAAQPIPHSHVGSNVSWVLWNRRQANRYARDDGSRTEPKERGKDQDSSIAVAGLPAESEDPGADSGEEQHVHAAISISEDAWKDPAGAKEAAFRMATRVKRQSGTHSTTDGERWEEKSWVGTYP